MPSSAAHADLARRPVVRLHLGAVSVPGERERVDGKLKLVAAGQALRGVVDGARLVVEDHDRRPALAHVDPVDHAVEAHRSAVLQRDGRRFARVSAEAEPELATAGPRHDPETGADVLVGVDERHELAQDPPTIELPQQRSPGEPFALGLVAVTLADRQQKRALAVGPRLVG